MQDVNGRHTYSAGTPVTMPEYPHQPYRMPNDERVSEIVLAKSPPWGWFDSFLRRAVMIGAAVLIWGAITAAVTTAVMIYDLRHETTTDAPLLPPYDCTDGQAC